MSEVVIKFEAEWCGPCKQVDVVLLREIPKHPDRIYTKVDIEEMPEVAEAFGVGGVPTVVVLSANGEELERAVGAAPTAQLLRK